MPIFVGVRFAVEVVSNESAVVENASFLLRSLYLHLLYEVPHWLLYISKFTQLPSVPCDSTALVNTAWFSEYDNEANWSRI